MILTQYFLDQVFAENNLYLTYALLAIPRYYDPRIMYEHNENQLFKREMVIKQKYKKRSKGMDIKKNLFNRMN